MRAAATQAERRHMQRVSELPCCACGAEPPSEVHHITDSGRRLGNFFTLPLCTSCHRGSNGFSGINREAWDKSLTSQLKLCVSTWVLLEVMR